MSVKSDKITGNANVPKLNGQSVGQEGVRVKTVGFRQFEVTPDGTLKTDLQSGLPETAFGSSKPYPNGYHPTYA